MANSAPDWLKYKGKSFNKSFNVIRQSVNQSSLATVCESASCPNRTECWSAGTATFMLMGDTCTRGCRFCNVKTSRHPPPLNTEEPDLLVKAVRKWGDLRYIVLTSVDRDDLPDGGADHFASCIRRLQSNFDDLNIEVLIPDFSGDTDALDTIIESGAKVIAHNIETVKRLTPRVRDRRASYKQSLEVLSYLKTHSNRLIKSSIMLGFSETKAELRATLEDLRAVGVDIITIGQYMQPSFKHLPVRKYYTPEEFEEIGRMASDFGFLHIVSSPLSRSSYKAGEIFLDNYLRNR